MPCSYLIILILFFLRIVCVSYLYNVIVLNIQNIKKIVISFRLYLQLNDHVDDQKKETGLILGFPASYRHR